MLNEGGNSEVVIGAVFYELFTAAKAVKALNQVGFEDSDVELVGVLAGMPDLSWLSRDMGMPLEHAQYYESCCEDGAVLVMVRARRLTSTMTALAVLRQQGGVLAPTMN
jgi:hypothetical protein